MFDWSDEELTNIIWGESGETDDHIVPYPGQTEEKPPVVIGDSTKKEADQNTSDVSPLRQRRQSFKSKNDIGAPAVGLGISDPPTSTAAAASSDITKCSENGSLKDSGIFENPTEDGEQGDFVDYGWANIGSFDDLDRIFSNNDPIFGDASVANADELWPSSKNVIGPPLSGDSSDLSVGPRRTSIEQTETNAQYMLDPGQSCISGCDKPTDNTSRASQDVQTFLTSEKIQTWGKQLNNGTVATLDEFRDNGIKQNKSPKCQRSSQMSELRHPQSLSSRWINNTYAQPMVNHQSSPLVLSQQIPRQRPMPFHPLNHFPDAPLASPLDGNMMNQYSSGYEVPTINPNPLKNSENSSMRPPEMTPKEKVEKLRRRQQMRAIIAIQKQQLQFKNRASGSGQSSFEGGKVEVDESLVSFPSLEPNSPVEQYESNTISSTGLDNCSVEESVLYRLQDTVAKMDLRTRLCIRDSLFRLAQSAMLRQYPNDTSSASANSKDEVHSDKDILSHERFTRMPDVETDTNPIDRSVAHLLFHRPLEFSGKPIEISESPLSANLPYVKNSKSESPSQLSEGNQSRSCLLTCENAMDDENANEG